MKKNKDISLYIIIFLDILLFLSMLVLCGLYLNLRINGNSSSLPEIPESDKWVLSGTGYDVQSGAKSILEPTFIGFKTSDGKMTAASYTSSARTPLLTYLNDTLSLLMSENVEIMSFPNNTQKEEFVSSLTESPKFFYAAYYSEVPSAVFLPATKNNFSSVAPEVNFYLKYIFILPDDQNNVYAVCLSDDLDVAILRSTENIEYTVDELSAYNGVRGFADFSFMENSIRPVAYFTESFDVDSVVIAESENFYSFNLQDVKTLQLLRVLDFNTNMVRMFSSGDGNASSFVDSGKELYISNDKYSIEYSAYDSGIHMSAFLGYYPESRKNYSLTDAVYCVRLLLNSFDQILVGGNAFPSIVGVYQNDTGSIIFEFKYLYNGVLLNDNDYDILIEIKDNYIINIKMDPIFCDSGRLFKPVVPQKLAIELLNSGETNDAENSETEYYAMFESDPLSNQIQLIWTAKKRIGD